MRLKLSNCRTACLSILFVFVCTGMFAQSNAVKEALAEADKLYAREKFEEALTLYLQQWKRSNDQPQCIWLKAE